MTKYSFPAIITPDSNGYNVQFYDIENAFTCGETLAEAYEMAVDVLSLMLLDMEENGISIPNPTNPNDIINEPASIVILVFANTAKYKAKINLSRIKE